MGERVRERVQVSTSRQGPPLREGWDAEVGRPLWWARLLALAALVGGALGLVGFLSDELLICLFDWLGMVVVGAGLAGLLVPPMVRGLRRAGAGPGPAVAAALVLAAAPISAFAAAFGLWAWSPVARALSPADWYFKTLVVEVLLAGAWFGSELALRRRRASPAPAGEPASEPDSDPSAVDVICLQMEDHYVRIHRPGGVRMELLPLRDAIRKYGQARGVQVHRSWWVARDAIRAIEREGRNWRLRLDGGLLAPVARNRIAQLREAGIPIESPG